MGIFIVYILNKLFISFLINFFRNITKNVTQEFFFNSSIQFSLLHTFPIFLYDIKYIIFLSKFIRHDFIKPNDISNDMIC